MLFSWLFMLPFGLQGSFHVLYIFLYLLLGFLVCYKSSLYWKVIQCFLMFSVLLLGGGCLIFKCLVHLKFIFPNILFLKLFKHAKSTCAWLELNRYGYFLVENVWHTIECTNLKGRVRVSTVEYSFLSHTPNKAGYMSLIPGTPSHPVPARAHPTHNKR